MRDLIPDSLGFTEAQLALTGKMPPMGVNSKQLDWIEKRRISRRAPIKKVETSSGKSLHAKRRHAIEVSAFTARR